MTTFPHLAHMAIISTGHVARYDMHRMSSPQFPWSVARTKYGVILWIPQPWTREHVKEAMSMRLSKEWRRIIKALAAKKVEYVYFDRDGGYTKGWRKFDW